MGNTSSSSKILRHNRRKRSDHKETNVRSSASSVTSTASSLDGSISSRTTPTSTPRKWKIDFKDQTIPKGAPKALEIARDWIQSIEDRNVPYANDLTHQDCLVWLDDEISLSLEEFLQAIHEVHDSFPDFTVVWKSMEVELPDQHGQDSGLTRVILRDYRGQGHHTGKPYGFGPYEPIPATGKYVEDAKVQADLWVKDNSKIIKTQLRSKGAVVGPPRFYTEIGGTIF